MNPQYAFFRRFIWVLICESVISFFFDYQTLGLKNFQSALCQDKFTPTLNLFLKKSAAKIKFGLNEQIFLPKKQPYQIDIADTFLTSSESTDWEGFFDLAEGKRARILTNGAIQTQITTVTSQEGNFQIQLELMRCEMVFSVSSRQLKQVTNSAKEVKESLPFFDFMPQVLQERRALRDEIVLLDPRFLVLLEDESEIYARATETGTFLYCLSGVCLVETTFDSKSVALASGMGIFVDGRKNSTSEFNLNGRRLSNLYKRIVRPSFWWEGIDKYLVLLIRENFTLTFQGKLHPQPNG